ncbi:hypothetical protein BGZ98_001564, partial [Dissophora globulifera]
MADHHTTTTVHHTTTKAAATKTAATTRVRTPTLTATGTHTATPTATPAPAAGGVSVAMIGGIAGGVVVIVALVGLVIYKRRKRAAVGAVSSTPAVGKGGASAVGNAPRSIHNAISGPMSLAPDDGIASLPAHRSEAQFREQKQFPPNMRDELFAKPGGNLQQNTESKSPNMANAAFNGASPPRPAPPYKKEPSPVNSYDDQLVSDYFGAPDTSATAAPIGAQRSAPQPKDVTHGNLTPAPEYYLGKEDIDPRRDLRGFDTPEAYMKRAAPAPE